MNGPARIVLAVVFAISASNQAYGQVNAQPAPDPVVTAQNQAWYLNGDPVTYAGNIYYLAGPRTYFNRYEMIRSGFFQGVPIYTRTTIEPYSVVFVPIGGSLMQPYERRRAGDVAGTVGSTTPSFPGVTPSEQGAQTTAATAGIVQAPAPPTGVADSAVELDAHRVVRPEASPDARPVGTSGRVAPRPARPLRTAERPKGLNGVYVEFDRQRYFSSGAPVLIGRGTFERIGEHHGLPVYVQPGDWRTIYIPIQRNADLMGQYSRRDR